MPSNWRPCCLSGWWEPLKNKIQTTIYIYINIYIYIHIDVRWDMKAQRQKNQKLLRQQTKSLRFMTCQGLHICLQTECIDINNINRIWSTKTKWKQNDANDQYYWFMGTWHPKSVHICIQIDILCQIMDGYHQQTPLIL